MGMVWELVFGGMLLGLLFWELTRVRQSQREDREKAAAKATVDAAKNAADQDASAPTA